MTALSVLLIALIMGLLMLLLTRQQRRRLVELRPVELRPLELRPLRGYRALLNQVGRAVESGRQIHVGLGRGGLHQVSSPASLAALRTLENLAGKSSASTAPPFVTVNDGTLLLAAQDKVRQAYDAAGRTGELAPAPAQFMADSAYPFVYAAAANALIHSENVGSNILLGHFGVEIGIVCEAGSRRQVAQIVGSVDLEAVALAMAVTDDVLVGEEMLAAGAYLEGKPSQIASVQAQDVLRWVIALAVLVNSVIYFWGGSG